MGEIIVNAGWGCARVQKFTRQFAHTCVALIRNHSGGFCIDK